jgi:hypothetical protein
VVDDDVEEPSGHEGLEVEDGAVGEEPEDPGAEEVPRGSGGEEARDDAGGGRDPARLPRQLPEEEALRHLVEDDGDPQGAQRVRVAGGGSGRLQGGAVEELMDDEAGDDEAAQDGARRDREAPQPVLDEVREEEAGNGHGQGHDPERLEGGREDLGEHQPAHADQHDAVEEGVGGALGPRHLVEEGPEGEGGEGEEEFGQEVPAARGRAKNLFY